MIGVTIHEPVSVARGNFHLLCMNYVIEAIIATVTRGWRCREIDDNNRVIEIWFYLYYIDMNMTPLCRG